MILTIKSKVSKALENNYSVAACDACQAQCEESRVLGNTAPKGRKAALEAAHKAGWVDRQELDQNRRRRTTWTIRLICPACQAEAPAT